LKYKVKQRKKNLMEKTKINNTHYIILGALGTAFVFCFLLALFFIVKSYVKTEELSKFGSAGDFFNGFITPFISAISAILIYIAFKQQLDSNIAQEDRFTTEMMINKADKDFDRYMKLIDDVERYEQRIIFIRDVVHHSYVPKPLIGNDGINAYVEYILTEKQFRQFQSFNRLNVEKSLFTHFVNINFILLNVEKLKPEFKSYYILLCTKLFINIPHIISQINYLIRFESVITNDGQNDIGKDLYNEIMNAKIHIDNMKKIETQ